MAPHDQHIPHSSHWGAFSAHVVDDEIVELVPADSDSNPTSLIHDLAEAVGSSVRVARPAVRKSWYEAVRGRRAGGTDASRAAADAHDRAADGHDRATHLRGAEPFVEIDWDEALDLVAGELTRVRRDHGNASIFGGSYGWSSAGRFHHARTQLHRFLVEFGGHTTQVGNYSYGAAAAILPRVLGPAQYANGLLTSWDVIEGHTGMWVMFGGLAMKNSQIESGGLSNHSTESWLRRLRAAGCEFVSVSPIGDDAADFLDAEWMAVRPNTDTALMLGLAHTLLVEGLHDEGFLTTHCTGWDRFRDYLLGDDTCEADAVGSTGAHGTTGPLDADWAAEITGIDAEAIRTLARRMTSTRTMISASWSLQRADHGEQPYWAALALAAMLGQIGLPGGGVGFGYGSTGTMGNAQYPFPAPRLPVGENPVDAPIPAARITDMLLGPGEQYEFDGRWCTYPDIRLVYWAGGNPFHHQQDLNKLRRAWQRPETVIVHEQFWTATARFADIVLPATTTLERNDIGAASGDPRLIAMHRAITPRLDARADFDIFTGLAERLGIAEAFTEGRTEMEWIEFLYDSTRTSAAAHGIELPDFDRFWADGGVDIPVGSITLLADYRADLDLFPLGTPSGRIELFSETIAGFGYDDCPGHPAWLAPEEWLGAASARSGSLHLISNQPKQRLHSQLDMTRTSRESEVDGREPCRINPADAARRGISDGDIVRIFNDRGACLAGVELSPLVREGVLQLSAGAWYQAARSGADPDLEVHGNPNVLTHDHGTSRLGQGPTAHSALVEVEVYAEGAAPAVTVTSAPPEFAATSD